MLMHSLLGSTGSALHILLIVTPSVPTFRQPALRARRCHERDVRSVRITIPLLRPIWKGKTAVSGIH